MVSLARVSSMLTPFRQGLEQGDQIRTEDSEDRSNNYSSE